MELLIQSTLPMLLLKNGISSFLVKSLVTGSPNRTRTLYSSTKKEILNRVNRINAPEVFRQYDPSKTGDLSPA